MHKTLNLVVLALVSLSSSACGGGGDWVDAPAPCMSVWSVIELSNLKMKMGGAPAPKVASSDLKEVIETEMQKERAKGTSEESLEEGRAAFEAMIAQGARTVCGNVGKSYTGTWECNAQQQRIKCK